MVSETGGENEHARHIADIAIENHLNQKCRHEEICRRAGA
jgi:hypothetical protein